MNALSLFRFEDKKSIRVIEIDGALHFVAADVADALDYTATGNLFGHVPKKWKGLKPVTTPGGVQQMLALAEPGLYFFLGRSDKLKALPFQMWLAEDVMPSIRKTGSYIAAPHKAAVATPDFDDPVAMARAWADAKEEARNESAKAEQLEHQVAELVPAAAGLERIASAEGAMCVTDAAKTLQMQPHKLRDALLEMKWMYRRQGKGGYVAYQDKIHTGYLKHKVGQYQDPETGEHKTNPQVLVTSKGLAQLSKLLGASLISPSAVSSGRSPIRLN
jgi:prophage antirepressor-like protein